MSRMILTLILAILVLAGVATFLFWPGARDEVETAPGDVAAIPDTPYWGDADRWVMVDGVRARVRIEGPEEGPVVVMVHGFSFSLETWDHWAADLATDYRVVRMDLPGHALTGPDPQARYSVDQTVDFVEQMITALEIEQASLIGNSLGGLVSWKLAARRPDLVEKLVLLSPGGFSINGVTEDPVPVPMGISFYLTQAPQPMIAAATTGLFGDASRMTDEMARRVGDMMRFDGVGQALVERLEVFTLPDPTAALAEVEADTLILWGENDRMVPPEHGPRFAALIPSARLVSLPGLGHIPHEEDPAGTIGEVRAFLAN